MKLPPKQQMLQHMAAQLPPAHLTPDGVVRIAWMLTLVILTDGCLILDWRQPVHVEFNDWLKSHLSPPLYQWCRGYMRFDGVPSGVI